jgi:probable rRNA maturation factor
MTAPQPVEIVIEDERWTSAHADTAVQAAMAALQGLEEPASLAILLADDAALQRLNRAFRGKDKPTNVLSFPAAPMPGNEAFLGDIAIAFDTLAREAIDEGKSLSDHLAHLVVHGVLHLLGEDHETPEEAEAMEAEERRILAGLGIADPYAMSEPEIGMAKDAVDAARAA